MNDPNDCIRDSKHGWITFSQKCFKKEKEMFRDKSKHLGGQKKLQLYRNTVCYKMIKVKLFIDTSH